jgi:hypothetical protein
VGDIFREIDEELKQEQYTKLWQDYGKYIIAIAVAVVLAVGGFQGWIKYQVAKRAEESQQFARAVSLVVEEKPKDAAALFAQLAETAGAGYAVLARFHRAALRVKSGDVAGAVVIYDALATDGSVEAPLNGAALVLSVLHGMDIGGADHSALMGRLEPLMNKDGPWRHSARELTGLMILKSGDRAKARLHFQALADDVDAPQGLRARAAQVLAVIGK